MAHLLVISSLRIPTVVYTMEQAKTIAFGYPFTFVRQDHSEWIGVSVFDGGKFPYTERLMLRLNDAYWSTLSHIDYGAMMCSSLVVFLLLLTGRQILKKIGSWIGI